MGSFGKRAEAVLLLVALIWGATFVVVKSALDDASTLVFLALRFTLASFVLLALFRRRFSNPGPLGVVWAGGAVAGLLLFLGYALQTAGLRITTASRSAFLTGLYIVLVPLLSSFVQKVVPSRVEWLGVGFAASGTVLMTSGDLRGGFNLGDALTVGCAVAFAGHILVVAYYSRRMNYEVLSILQVGMVAALSIATFRWVETPFVVWSPRLAVAVVATAVLATAVTFALYTWAQRQTTATRAALIFSTEPVFAGLTAWLAAGEAWTVRSVTGAALILGGIVTVELKPPGPARHPSD